jgi:type IV pilus assembly protein PilC
MNPMKKYTVKAQLLDMLFCKVFEAAKAGVNKVFWVIHYNPSLSFPPLVEEMNWWIFKKPPVLPKILEYWEEESSWRIIVEELQGISIPTLMEIKGENFQVKELLTLVPKLTNFFQFLHFSQIQLPDMELFLSRLYYTAQQEFKLLPSVLYLALKTERPFSLEIVKAKRESRVEEHIQYMGKMIYYLLTRSNWTEEHDLRFFPEDTRDFLGKMISGKIHDFTILNQFAASILASMQKESSDPPVSEAGFEEKTRSLPAAAKPSLKTAEKKEKDFFLFDKNSRISGEDLIVFTRGMGAILQTGIPLLTGLKLISGQKESVRLSRLCTTLALKLEKGETLTSSVSQFPKVFPPYFTAMIAAGEESGSMTQIFSRLSVFLEKEVALSKKVKTALTYPAFLLVTSIIFTFGIVDFTFPHFFALLQGFSVKVPIITRIVMEGVNFFQNSYDLAISASLILLAAAAVFAITRVYLPHLPKEDEEAIKEKIDGLKLRIPLIGAIVKKINSTVFCRTLAALYASGIPFKNSLLLSREVMNNYVFRKEVTFAITDLIAGKTISESLTTRRIFPSLVAAMIALGEETGELEKALNKVSDYYDQEVERSLETLNSMLEPFILVVLGLLIGSLILSIFIPLYQILQHIKA